MSLKAGINDITYLDIESYFAFPITFWGVENFSFDNTWGPKY